MEDKITIGIIGIIALAIVAICFFGYLHSTRQSAITSADIAKAREIAGRLP